MSGSLYTAADMYVQLFYTQMTHTRTYKTSVWKDSQARRVR